MRRTGVAAIAIVTLAAGCGDDPQPSTGAGTPADASTTAPDTTASAAGATTEEADAGEAAPDEQRFPDVVAAEATVDGDGTWTFAVTISSPYDTPERYADAWRVVGPDGAVLGERILLHDHADEQPFTRSLSGVEIDADVDTVTVEGRDLRYGYGGGTLTIDLERTAP